MQLLFPILRLSHLILIYDQRATYLLKTEYWKSAQTSNQVAFKITLIIVELLLITSPVFFSQVLEEHYCADAYQAVVKGQN